MVREGNYKKLNQGCLVALFAAACMKQMSWRQLEIAASLI